MAAKNTTRSEGGKVRRVIVVGGGLAGLMTVIKLCEAKVPVDLLSLVPVKRSHSVCAQGGINASVNIKGEGELLELPFRLLILADLSMGSSTDRETDLDSRRLRSLDGKNLDAVVAQVDAAHPSAVLMVTAGAATVPLVRGLRKVLPGVLMAGVSASLTGDAYKQLGETGRGLAVTMVMPDPTKGKNAVVRDYQAAMKVRGQQEFGLGSLEGYVNMRVLAEGLERAGSDPTRAKLRSALAGSGAEVSQTPDQRLWIALPGEAVFPAGRSAVTPAAGAWLDKIAAALRGLPRAELQIVGPTDARGAGGQALALDRAASARDWMVVRGVAAQRMAVSGADPRGRAPAVDGRLHILAGERATP